LPTLQSYYPDDTAQFRAGTADSLCHLAEVVGKDYTQQKIMPMLMDLIKDDNAEVKLNVINGLKKISNIIGTDILQQNFIT